MKKVNISDTYIKQLYKSAPAGLRFLYRENAFTMFITRLSYRIASYHDPLNKVVSNKQKKLDVDIKQNIMKAYKANHPNATDELLKNLIDSRSEKINKKALSRINYFKPFLYLFMPLRIIAESPESERFDRYGKGAGTLRFITALIVAATVIYFTHIFTYELLEGISVAIAITAGEALYMFAIFAHEYMANVMTRNNPLSPYNEMRKTSNPLLDDLYDEIIRPLKAVYNTVVPHNSKWPLLWKISYIIRLLLSIISAAALVCLELIQIAKTVATSFVIFVGINFACFPFLISDGYYGMKNKLFGAPSNPQPSNVPNPVIENTPSIKITPAVSIANDALLPNLGYTPKQYEEKIKGFEKNAKFGTSQGVLDMLQGQREMLLKNIIRTLKNRKWVVDKEEAEEWHEILQVNVFKGINPNPKGEQLSRHEKLKDQLAFFQYIVVKCKSNPDKIREALEPYKYNPVPHNVMYNI